MTRVNRIYKVGGLSSILISIMYVVITLLYLKSGALPKSTDELLAHLHMNKNTWWAISILSIVTDILFIPFVYGVYNRLKRGNKIITVFGCVLVLCFVILDLVITWPEYIKLINLSEHYYTGLSGPSLTALITEAKEIWDLLTSKIFSLYAILAPSLGILLISINMPKDGYRKVSAYTGIATGIIGIISVSGSFFMEIFSAGTIFTSILTTLWLLFAGRDLFRSPS